MKIYEAFDEVLGKKKINTKFAFALRQYRNSYLDGSRDHLEFYGKFLTGHIAITFKTTYEHRLYEELLQVDKNTLLDARRRMEAIDTSRKITSDIYNLTVFYLARRITLENKLPKRVLKEMQRDLMLLFCYRTMSALHNRYYQHLVSKTVAEETSNKLVNLFIVKRLGSWHKYMEYRAAKVYDKSRKDFKRLISDKDDDFLSVIVKIQGAIRSTMKKVFVVMLDVKKRSGSVTNRSISINIDGDDDILEVTDGVEATINKVVLQLTTKAGYTNKKIIEGLCDHYLAGYKPRTIEDMMLKIYRYQQGRNGKEVVEYVRNLIAFVHHARVVAINKPRNHDETIRMLRGILISSRSTDPKLLKLRKQGLEIVKKSTKRSANQFLIKARLAFNLYIITLYLK